MPQINWPRANLYRSLPSKPGIYMIRFRNGQAVYIGSSINMLARMRSHLREIQNGKFMDSGRYEPGEIEVSVLELVDDPTTLEAREIAHIDAARSQYNLVNKIKPGRHHRE